MDSNNYKIPILTLQEEENNDDTELQVEEEKKPRKKSQKEIFDFKNKNKKIKK